MKEKGRFYQRAVAIQRNIKVYFRLSFGETLVRHWWCHTFVCNWEWVLFYNSWSHGHTLSHIEIFLLSSRLFLSNKYSCPADDSQGSSDWLTVTAKHTHTHLHNFWNQTKLVGVCFGSACTIMVMTLCLQIRRCLWTLASVWVQKYNLLSLWYGEQHWILTVLSVTWTKGTIQNWNWTDLNSKIFSTETQECPLDHITIL